MSETTRLSVRDSVGAALRFVRENLRFVASAAAIGAVGSAVIAALAAAVPGLGVVTTIASTVLQAFIYAAFVGAFLFGTQAVRSRVGADGGRVWTAMAIVGVLMGIVMFVVSIPVMIALLSGPMAPYAPELTAAGSDQAAVMAIMTRFVEQNPGALLSAMLFYFVIWFLLTSKLYLAAPASVDQGRILTFETWNWTKGALLRIIAARLMLLIPAYVLSFALSYLIGAGLGVNPTDPASMVQAAAANQVAFLIYAAVSTFVTFVIYTALEAGLSAAIYRALKPAAAPSAA